MNVLVLNCGSSSVKFPNIETSLERIDAVNDRCLARGIIERGGGHGLCTFHADGQAPVITAIEGVHLRRLFE